ncbi:hypothetical protein CR513_14218, partial [Mucuna pruriens]
MVLKKILPNSKDQSGKWVPNYEGPYMVKRSFSGRALILTDAEGQDLKHPTPSRCSSLEVSLGQRQKRQHPNGVEERLGKSSIKRLLPIFTLCIRPRD